MKYIKKHNLCFILLALNVILGIFYYVVAEVTEKAKNEAGIIASSSKEQLFTAVKNAVSSITVPDAAIRDIAVSPDNLRVYTVDSAGKLNTYSVTSTEANPVPSLTSLSAHSLSPLNSPKSLESNGTFWGFSNNNHSDGFCQDN